MVAVLYALICLIWGSTWLVIKIGLIGVPPFLGAGLRFTLASTVLFALIALRGTKIRLEREDKICILSCGLLSFALSYACVYWAEQYISSGLAAILYCMMPLATALLSRFWTRSETLSGRKIGGILVAMAGTAVLFWPGQGVSRAELWGTAVALLSVVCAAVNLVMVKRHGRHTDIYIMNAFGMAIGAALLLTLSARRRVLRRRRLEPRQRARRGLPRARGLGDHVPVLLSSREGDGGDEAEPDHLDLPDRGRGPRTRVPAREPPGERLVGNGGGVSRRRDRDRAGA